LVKWLKSVQTRAFIRGLRVSVTSERTAHDRAPHRGNPGDRQARSGRLLSELRDSTTALDTGLLPEEGNACHPFWLRTRVSQAKTMIEALLLADNLGRNLMKITTSLYDCAEHLRTPEEWQLLEACIES